MRNKKAKKLEAKMLTLTSLKRQLHVRKQAPSTMTARHKAEPEICFFWGGGKGGKSCRVFGQHYCQLVAEAGRHLL